MLQEKNASFSLKHAIDFSLSIHRILNQKVKVEITYQKPIALFKIIFSPISNATNHRKEYSYQFQTYF